MKPINLALVCLALVAGFIAPDIIQTLQQAGSKVDLSQYCMLSTQPCQQNGAVIQLQHDVVHPLQPSTLTVQWPTQDKATLSAQFEGLEMQMGIACYTLTRQNDGSYQATLLLPVCTAEKMTWLGKISDGYTTVYPAIRMDR